MTASMTSEPTTETQRVPFGRTLPPSLRAGAPAWIWIGVGVAVVGFAVIAFTWGQVAGEGEVYRQIPYLVSGGVVGLGLLMIGLTVLNITSRQRDGMERDRQIAELIRAIEAMREPKR